MAAEVHGGGGDPPFTGLHNINFGDVYVSDLIWRRRYMAPEVHGGGGDPSSAGRHNTAFGEVYVSEDIWHRRRSSFRGFT